MAFSFFVYISLLRICHARMWGPCITQSMVWVIKWRDGMYVDISDYASPFCAGCHADLMGGQFRGKLFALQASLLSLTPIWVEHGHWKIANQYTEGAAHFRAVHKIHPTIFLFFFFFFMVICHRHCSQSSQGIYGWCHLPQMLHIE